MILRPQIDDVKVVGYYLGNLIVGIAIVSIIPLIACLVSSEWDPALDFTIGISISFLFGYLMLIACRTKKEINWTHGMIVVSLSWVVASVFGAIPLYLSDHFMSFLDAVFEAMSGYATTGLTLAVDLDHMSYGHNLWRHLIMFIGGQGIVVVALTFLIKAGGGAFKMYVGEARDERIMPNIIHTARFIWLVSIVYLVLGTLGLGIASTLAGMPFGKSLFHGACITMAAFDTGGFAPQSQNVLYYHSGLYESINIILMFFGAINFKLHYALWVGNKREIYKNVETRLFAITIVFTFFLTAVGLAKTGIYSNAVVLFRKGFYHLISGHTGTGHGTLYARQFATQWNELSLIGIVIAMALGGAVCSTTGAIKMLRVALIFKAFKQDVKQFLSAESAVIIQKLHHVKDIIIEDKQTRAAALIMLAYILCYFFGAIIGVLYGYPFLLSLFESTSACANVGLSCGITTPSMPWVLKVVYIFQMWAGRLEFISVFVFMGFLISAVRGKS